MGHRIDKYGLYTDTSKVNAKTKTPIPENVSQLRALLGFINYCPRIPNVSVILILPGPRGPFKTRDRVPGNPGICRNGREGGVLVSRSLTPSAPHPE